MGAWGTGIFQEDFACEVESTYRDLVSLGLKDSECISQLEKQFALHSTSDSLDYTTYWVALALIQHKLGRLDDHIKKRALEVIDSGRALELWSELVDQDSASIKKRESVLLKARAKILSPSPKRKSLKLSEALKAKIDQTFDPYPWMRGGIYAYRLPNNVYVILCCVITLENRYVGYYKKVGDSYVREDPPPLLCPFLLLLDYRSPRLPTINEAAEARPLLMELSEDSRCEFIDYARDRAEHAKKLLSENYESFRARVCRAERDATEEELQERFALWQKSSELQINKFSEPQKAIEMLSYKVFRMDPLLPIPRDRIQNLEVSREFFCEYRYYATDWEQLNLSIARWTSAERPLGEMIFGIDPIAKEQLSKA